MLSGVYAGIIWVGCFFGAFVCLLAFSCFLATFLVTESWPRALCVFHHFSAGLLTFVPATGVCKKVLIVFVQICGVSAL